MSVQKVDYANQPMKALGLQNKLIKHLDNKNDIRVRDYIIHIRVNFPNLDECPVDTALLKRACDFLRSRGWKLYLGEDHNDRPSRYIRKSC